MSALAALLSAIDRGSNWSPYLFVQKRGAIRRLMPVFRAPHSGKLVDSIHPKLGQDVSGLLPSEFVRAAAHQ